MFSAHDFYKDYVEQFVEDNESKVVEAYADDNSLSSEWMAENHGEELEEFASSWFEEDINELIKKDIAKRLPEDLEDNTLYVFPRDRVLFDKLLSREEGISESSDRISMVSRLNGKPYSVEAVAINNVFVLVSIYNEEDHKEECLLK